MDIPPLPNAIIMRIIKESTEPERVELEKRILELETLKDRFKGGRRAGARSGRGWLRTDAWKFKEEVGDWRVKYGFEPCKKSMPVYAEYGWWNDFDGNFEDDTLYRCDKFCWGEELSGKVIKAPKRTRSGKCY